MSAVFLEKFENVDMQSTFGAQKIKEDLLAYSDHLMLCKKINTEHESFGKEHTLRRDFCAEVVKSFAFDMALELFLASSFLFYIGAAANCFSNEVQTW